MWQREGSQIFGKSRDWLLTRGISHEILLSLQSISSEATYAAPCDTRSLHFVDMMIEQQMLSYGAAIGYFSGDVKGLVDDIAALKPTIFIGVPRVYDRIYAGVMDQVKKTGRPCLPQNFEDIRMQPRRRGWAHVSCSNKSDF